MIHSKDNFIRPYSVDDKVIYIQDVNDIITFEINPHDVTSTYHFNKFIYVKLHGTDNPIEIEFSDETEALLALTIFQSALNQAQNLISNIPPSIINYINNNIPPLNVVSYHQITPSVTWNVPTHTLNKMGNVTVTNDNFEEIVGLVTYIDNFNVKIEFNNLVSGWVFIS